MFTDITGYTVLMGKDEERAFGILQKNREIHTKLTDKHHGTLIKEIGDGMLISFSSSSDAVRCALEIQTESKKENISLKIGIHEGEMVFDRDDVHGDGVNIASRLQDITETGSITISDVVHRNVKNKPGIYTAYIG
jgi:class 3 adenylate cyclase